MSWDFAELRRLCRARKRPDPRTYTNALQWKCERADLHAKAAQLARKRLTPANTKVWVDSPAGHKWQSVETAETEAAAQTLHSMGDLLAQILNCAVIPTPLAEDKVGLHRVRQESAKLANAGTLVRELDSLRKSPEWQYIEAFVNTIKHRHLLDTEYTITSRSAAAEPQGIKFLQFTYNGRALPAAWAADITGPYRMRLFDLITNVGNATNAFLR